VITEDAGRQSVAAYDPSNATTAPDLALTAVIEHWNGSTFVASCPVVDGGFQRVTLTATGANGSFTRSLQIIKRRP